MSKPLFKRFAFYNILFLLLQIAWIIFKSNSFVSAIPLPLSVVNELIITLLIQFLLCIFLSFIQTLCLWGWKQFSNRALWTLTFPIHAQSILIISTIGALFFANGYFFPLSVFSRTLLSDVPKELILFLLISALSIISFFIGLTSYFAIKKTSIIGIFCIACLIRLFLTYPSPILLSNTQQSNLIIIGIDSLSPKEVQPKHMPTLYTLLHQSMWFSETISPLARTYPAWSTILTGLHPFHHSARYNLTAQTKPGHFSIAWLLQKQGYQTWFATDDRRFNPIDKLFGFQHIMGPRCGVNDILIGTFNDFLLGNLLINTPIGRWLFPYNYANRASYFSYYPSTFNTALKEGLLKRTPNKPLFLAVHFTLPHWPYAFASAKAHEVENEYDISNKKALYQTALKAVDIQLADLIQTLKAQHLLDNTLLVLLSDHGETLYTPGSRQTTLSHYQRKTESLLKNYFAKYTTTELDKSAGHGSDLLSADQYHCVLGLQIYKNQAPQKKPQIITTRVGLQDVAPTLLDYVHLSTPQMDGLSLFNLNLPTRSFILESGMLPNQFFSPQKARQVAQSLFKITPKRGFLRVRKDKIAQLDNEKLYAILQEDWLLALYPTARGYLPIVQQISTHHWVDRLDTAFAQQAPVVALLKQLEEFYHHSWKIVSSI